MVQVWLVQHLKHLIDTQKITLFHKDEKQEAQGPRRSPDIIMNNVF